MARRLILATGGIDYPKDRLEIQVLDDSTDETQEIARAAVDELRAQGVDADYVRRPSRHGYKAGEIHGDMDQSSRIAELDRFKAGTINILVASDVAARGLDVKGVSHVFNFDAPWHPDDYVHRIGRTGRAGAKGRAFTLVTSSDDEAVDNIQKLTGYQIPVHGGGAVAAGAAGTDRDTDEAEPRRGRSCGGRGKGAAKPEKVPSRPAPAAEARPTRSSRDDRKPRHDEPDGPDDGWNGPMPGFLSVGFGN